MKKEIKQGSIKNRTLMISCIRDDKKKAVLLDIFL